MDKLSIIIPSRQEIFLKKTILDVLEKSTGDIEVFPVLDGYDIPKRDYIEDKRVKYIKLPKNYYTQKRHGINLAVSICKGKYVMSLDAHCMMAKGFDEVLKKDLEKDWVAIPRRHRLDAENWCLQTQCDDRPPIDYEYLMWPLQFNPIGFHGYKWDERTLSRLNIPIDDTITFQGSCWIMHKSYFLKQGFMHIEGYTGWGMEAEEISFTTWLSGGRVITNKKTFYAHLHKGTEYGRMYFLPKAETRLCNKYCYGFWTQDKPLKYRIHNFSWLIKKFWPLPGWPNDWQERMKLK